MRGCIYRATEMGNMYEFRTAGVSASRQHRLKLEHGLDRALEEEQFVLHYQPQVDLTSRRVTGVEVLLRWQHPELGLISPVQFVPLAEETGCIVALGEWALKTACWQSRIWREAGLPPLRIAVNLSARQFMQKNVLEMVARVLRDAASDPCYLELELTESIGMPNAQGTIETLRKLKKMGIWLSIDDFGTGYSSLSYLTRFPIDKLKIDRSFIRDLASDPNDALIVQAVINLGHSLHYSVTAEGVETTDQLDFLRSRGCDEAQGYYFSAPLPAANIPQFLRENLDASLEPH